jgi:hypothetical protein
MTQDYQMIGQASAELEAVAAQHEGWGPTVSQPVQHDTPQSMAGEATDSSDYSFWDRRANMQLMRDGNMASHMETPMAAVDVRPAADAS